MVRRNIVRIDQELCNGCGLCVTPCAEGAIEIVDGKAQVLKEELCDGAGFCLAVCPTGALSIEEREAPAFDHHQAELHAQAAAGRYILQSCFRCDANEQEAVLLPCRTQGQSLWVCTHCLPTLIHG
ncbi:MAG: 4Fe-4S binding protein [Anaerolineae bacterium]|nr:4Fe-4S binding protein [Anaerolineae bacterium]